MVIAWIREPGLSFLNRQNRTPRACAAVLSTRGVARSRGSTGYRVRKLSSSELETMVPAFGTVPHPRGVNISVTGTILFRAVGVIGNTLSDMRLVRCYPSQTLSTYIYLGKQATWLPCPKARQVNGEEYPAVLVCQFCWFADIREVLCPGGFG